MLFNLSQTHSIANDYILELRDVHLQKDRMRFRRNMERLGEIMAYEVSKALTYVEKTIETPLQRCHVKVLDQPPVLITILRAGIPFMNGFLNIFDKADVGFVGAFRAEGTDEIKISLDYSATPPLDGRTVILIDPMLATGKSICTTIEFLVSKGKPSCVHIVSMIAAPEGLEFIKHAMLRLNVNYSLWVCVLDDYLDSQFYIVPGLGDAGDLSFGPK